MPKKISIITPCYNAERFIGETVESVVEQTALSSKRVELEYIICDGDSTDKTVSIIESFGNSSIKIVSEPDSGIYDALSKGLRQATGDIIAYINAGDYYDKHAFDIVLDIFETQKVTWLTGYRVYYSEKSYFIGVDLPFKYRSRFFACGFYGTTLPFVQQESTFWSSTLNELIDYDDLSSFNYAGDFYLWFQFSRKHDLKIVKAYLGGFKIHKGQLSKDIDAYKNELLSISTRPKMNDYALAAFDKLIGYAPTKIKKQLNKDGLFLYSHELQEWV